MSDCCCSPLGAPSPPSSTGNVLLAVFNAQADQTPPPSFFGPFSTPGPGPSEVETQIVLPQNYSINFVQLHCDAVGGVTGDTTAVLRIGGVNTALTPTIATGGNNSSAAGAVAYTAGQLVSVLLSVAPDAGTANYTAAIYGSPS